MGLHCKPKKIKKSDLDHNGTYLEHMAENPAILRKIWLRNHTLSNKDGGRKLVDK